MNKYDATARWVSQYGKKETLRNDSFAHSVKFTVKDEEFSYVVDAFYSPYGNPPQKFTLIIKKGKKVVCKYHNSENVPEIEIGSSWLRKSRL